MVVYEMLKPLKTPVTRLYIIQLVLAPLYIEIKGQNILINKVIIGDMETW